ARRPALRVEALEDRTVPTATITWDGGGDGFNWNNAANWSDDVLPGASDDVEIDYGANNFTVVHSTGSDSVHSLTSRVNLVHSGGSLSFAADSHLYGALTVSAGFGAAGNITIDGLFTWETTNSAGLGTIISGPGSLTAAGGTTITGDRLARLRGGFHYI